jgi:hypothetical protein
MRFLVLRTVQRQLKALFEVLRLLLRSVEEVDSDALAKAVERVII